MTDVIKLLLDLPQRFAQRPFVIDTVTGQELTYGQIDQAAKAVAADLRTQGFERGDKLGLVLNNSAEVAKIYLGCLYAGIVVVPINPVLPQKDLSFILEHSGAKSVVVSHDTLGLLGSKGEGSQPSALVIPEGKPRDLAEGQRPWSPSDLPPADGFPALEGFTGLEPMALVYTSGTTALPQGVMHSINDMIGNAALFCRWLGIGPENRFYGVLSMTYLGGYYNLLMLPYAVGASVVLANTFNAQTALNFWGPAKKHGVNTLWLVPTIMSILMELDRGKVGEEFCREQVKLCLCGTAPLPVALRAKFEKRYGVTAHENYALSETFFITSGIQALPAPEGSVGRVLPGMEIAIRGQDGQPLAYGQEGELWVNTPFLMDGYYDAESGLPVPQDQDGWFATGDVAIHAPTGEVYITGRKKDLIIKGGINVSPAAIENVLYSHPGVAECAVVGVPHLIYGENIAVVVRVSPGHEFKELEKELLKLCDSELSGPKQPAHILEIDQFPKNAAGKIQKNKVRDLLIQRLGLASLEQGRAPQAPPDSRPTMLPGRVRRAVERPAPEVVEQLKEFPASVVSDCLNRLGAMDGRIKSLLPGSRFCGSAITVEEVEGGNLMSHVALELIMPGDVLVIDAKGSTTRSCWGGLQTLMAQLKGAVALVINGYIRDQDEIVNLGMPVFALGSAPGGPLKGWSGNVNLPIACGGVVVNPGDVVMGDDDGVVVVPKEQAAQLPPLCRARLEMEQGWYQKIKAGESTLDAVGLRKKVKELGVVFES